MKIHLLLHKSVVFFFLLFRQLLLAYGYFNAVFFTLNLHWMVYNMVVLFKTTEIFKIFIASDVITQSQEWCDLHPIVIPLVHMPGQNFYDLYIVKYDWCVSLKNTQAGDPVVDHNCIIVQRIPSIFVVIFIWWFNKTSIFFLEVIVSWFCFAAQFSAGLIQKPNTPVWMLLLLVLLWLHSSRPLVFSFIIVCIELVCPYLPDPGNYLKSKIVSSFEWAHWSGTI